MTNTNHHLMGSFVRRFLLEELVADRNLSRNTQKSYRDTIRLLFDFLAERSQHAIRPDHRFHPSPSVSNGSGLLSLR